MPQMALGLIPTTNVTPPQALSTEQINLRFQKKLEDLEQQVGRIKAGINYCTRTVWEARWGHGSCAHLWMEQSGVVFWPETLCCVVGQDSLLSQCLSPSKFITGYQ